ncbi:ABC transporter substrate-binding protein [uncultured Selenomonas sp.]|jgi:putative ABC transport system substrate-binding protein|uniref:ABC transporter substrate-binding protein n=1 Tax=uncultured Selenomonas sp. TaxID=159275 RepID=UPI0025E5A186|nr:ABC transporter substrate-binding protein [uncultured Selenomonas sp.]MCI6100575.1 ABC transporter substrate-binding protein [Selenomonas sp.]MDD6128209.1 ABC transporter substrate-binding protein [Veillonellaceae bacterium]
MNLSHISKKMKLLSLGVATVFAAGVFAGCGGSQQAGSSSGKTYKIGVVQLVEHNALDAANKGFVDGLKERGYEQGKNVEFDQQNAQADQSNLQNIAQRFVSGKMDLICAIATPAAQTVANATKDIPIVGTAITDYVGAKLAASNEKPGGNITGTSDMNPIKEQIDLLLKIKPEAKTIGTIYCSSEVNSEVQIKAMQEYAESKGLTVKVATISTVNDLQQAAQSLVGSVDAFYEPTDNIVASAMPTLVAITDPAKIPVICAEPNMVKAGGLATYGIDYYKLGVQTGHMAADILEGKSKPADMSIEMAKDLKVTVNKADAARLGLTLPEDVLKDADIVE